MRFFSFLRESRLDRPEHSSVHLPFLSLSLFFALRDEDLHQRAQTIDYFSPCLSPTYVLFHATRRSLTRVSRKISSMCTFVRSSLTRVRRRKRTFSLNAHAHEPMLRRRRRLCRERISAAAKGFFLFSFLLSHSLSRSIVRSFTIRPTSSLGHERLSILSSRPPRRRFFC